MNRITLLVGAFTLVAAVGARSADASITIESYDITDAATSGFGLWGHSYDGSITATGSFAVDSFAYTRANYSGGSGTLNDGILGSSVFDTQLFPNTADASPAIDLILGESLTISFLEIALASFNGGNGIPGNIAGFDVTINSITQSFFTTDDASNTESVDLTGSVLDGLTTDRITLSNFQTTGGFAGFFSISEVILDGEATTNASPDIPEPTMFAIWAGLACCAAGAYRRQRRF